MLKRIISSGLFLLAAVFCFSLVSCDLSKDESSDGGGGVIAFPTESAGEENEGSEDNGGLQPNDSVASDTTETESEDYSALSLGIDTYWDTVFYPLKGYSLVVSSMTDDIWYVDEYACRFELKDNTAEAWIEDNYIRAQKAGSVTVTVSYDYEGVTYKGRTEFEFASPDPFFPEYPVSLYVSDAIELAFTESAEYYDYEAVTYEVTEGDASILQDEYGAQYLVASKAGTVSVLISYTVEGSTFSAVDTLAFTDHSFLISTPDVSEYFVGHGVTLGASCDTMHYFDEESVTYAVSAGEAEIEGAVIKAKKPGEVTVTASYVQNGVTLTASKVLNFVYDENVIKSAEDLEKLRNSSETFHLLNDVDLSDIASWSPINGFSGTLYGNGYSITGLSVTAVQHGAATGLFGTLDGTVEDLVLSGTVSCSGEFSDIGLLCGINRGTVKNVTVSGSIDASYSSNVGGVIGFSENCSVEGCTSSVSVTAKNFVGGIVGKIVCETLDGFAWAALTNHGEIIGNSNVGGIIGSIEVMDVDESATVTVNGFLNDGTVNGSANNVGGIFGMLKGVFYQGWGDTLIADFKLNGCTNKGEVSGLDNVGGILGYAPAYVSEISLCTNSAAVSGQMYVGGFAGRAEGTAMRDLKNTVTVTGKAYVGGIAGYAGIITACTNDASPSVVGYHTDENNISISCVGGIAGYAMGIVDCVNNASVKVPNGGGYVGGVVGYLNALRSASYVIQGNKNHGEVTGTSYVGGIAGALQVMHTEGEETVTVTSNVNDGVIIGSKNCVGGIFGYAAGDAYGDWNPLISYVRITSCANEAAVSGKDFVGGILGHSPDYVSEISICTGGDSVTGNLYVGGIAGYAKDTAMRDMKNTQTITGKAYLGGIAGYAGNLESCTNSGSIVNVDYEVDENSNKLSFVGGIAGYATGAVDCVNEKDLDIGTGGAYVGGIVGYLHKNRVALEPVSGNKNHGEIKGTECVGGIAGAFLVKEGSNNDRITVEGNRNDARITATGDCAGGIFGYATGNFCEISYTEYTSEIKIVSCTNEAAVSGADGVGGIVGYANAYVSELSLCQNLDDITGECYVGGYAGFAKDTLMASLKNSYTVTGKAYVGGIAGYCGTVSGCENNGTVKVTGSIIEGDDLVPRSYVGGIAGYATGAINCTNHKAIDAENRGWFVGGIVGYLDKNRTASEKVEGNVNHGEIKGTDCVGGVIGYLAVQNGQNNDLITVYNNKNDASVCGTGDCVGGIVGLARGSHYYYSYTDYYSYVKILNCTNEGDVKGENNVGGIVGYAVDFVSEISLCENLADVSGDRYVGGYAGRAEMTLLTELSNSYTVTGSAYVGGIAGYCGTVSGCKNLGSVKIDGFLIDESDYSKLSYVGGIAGYACEAVKCTNEKDIDASGGGKYVGGIVGYLCKGRAADAKVNGNKNYGTVKGTSFVGGIAGCIEVLGGEVNTDITVTADNNQNHGNIIATENCAGGIFGYADGSVYAVSYYLYACTLKIIACTNTANVSGADFVGGIVGKCGANVEKAAAAWSTNSFTGALNAGVNAENVGEQYGFMSSGEES